MNPRHSPSEASGEPFCDLWGKPYGPTSAPLIHRAARAIVARFPPAYDNGDFVDAENYARAALGAVGLLDPQRSLGRIARQFNLTQDERRVFAVMLKALLLDEE